MVADGTVVTSTNLDSTAIRLVPEFEMGSPGGGTITGGYTGPFWTCKSLRLRYGKSPSIAQISIPLATGVDETAPSVALVPSSPGRAIRGGDYVSVSASSAAGSAPMFCGSVVNIAHDFKSDTLDITALDHRYLLDGLKICGRFHISGTTAIVYQQGQRAVFNPDGLPNCTIGTGDALCFCPPNWGLANGERPPTTPRSGKACYWTADSVLQYLRWTFTSAQAKALAVVHKWFTQMPEIIDWPTGLSGALLLDTVDARKYPTLDLDGMRLTDALSATVETSGPYAINMIPLPDFRNQMQIVRSRYNGKGQTVMRAAGGAAYSTMAKVVATAGSYEEDFTETFTLVTVAGDIAYIERRADGYVDDAIEPAWSTADYTAWLTLVRDGVPAKNIDPASEKSFEAACAKYPRVLAAYRIRTDWDFMAGSALAGRPRANTSRSVLSSLLASFNENTALDTTEAKTTDTFPIRFEIYDSAAGKWFVATLLDGLRLDDDGTIWVPGLRQNVPSGSAYANCTWTGSRSDPAYIIANKLRATVAIPTDERLTEARRLASDATHPDVKISGDREDADRISSHLSRLYYADSSSLYKYWEQVQSYYIPEVAGGTVQTKVLRDDSDLAGAHAAKKLSDFGRVRRTGRLIYPHIYAAWSPGYMISSIKNIGGVGEYTVNACCQEVVFSCDGQTNTTELVLG